MRRGREHHGIGRDSLRVEAITRKSHWKHAMAPAFRWIRNWTPYESTGAHFRSELWRLHVAGGEVEEADARNAGGALELVAVVPEWCQSRARVGEVTTGSNRPNSCLRTSIRAQGRDLSSL
jgi:hypothetical protein